MAGDKMVSTIKLNSTRSEVADAMSSYLEEVHILFRTLLWTCYHIYYN